MRQDPDCVRLEVRAGVEPSPLPPVRIFLGTEEAQYRAERIFFYSIEKVRDPSRVYEIYLMKNIIGFDRQSWRTGFTNYRFAIPGFAGGKGKAIYNDVDQIYLADPALLFDLELGTHGFLAIHAKDTSVMLMDCERMYAIWNREKASSQGKKTLTNAPDANPGLYGQLDAHWNARDVEYIEGLTKCLHYTALHQQPWEPTPGDYSYHANPLAYIWHDLEAEADAEGYQIFSAQSPSPEFTQAVKTTGQTALNSNVEADLKAAGITSLLYVSCGGPPLEFDGINVQHHDVQSMQGWPEGDHDCVLIDRMFDVIPPVDAGWILDRSFRHARNVVWVNLRATEAKNPEMGSAEWWRERIANVAQAFDHASWRLDVSGAAAACFKVTRHAIAEAPVVWALTGTERDDEVKPLAESLGWPCIEKPLDFGRPPVLAAHRRKPSIDLVLPQAAKALAEPWPDIVVAAGEESALVARWIKRQSKGRTKLVQVGQPGGPFSEFDLILAAPDERLPIRPNVLQTAATLDMQNGAVPAAMNDVDSESNRGPTLVFLRSPQDGFALKGDAVREFAAAVRAFAERDGNPIKVVIEPETSAGLRHAFLSALGEDAQTIDAHEDADNVDALFASSEKIVATGDNLERLAQGVMAGKETAYQPLRKWHETVPVIRNIAKIMGLLTGGGRTYRGTPYQQHFVGRYIDDLTTRGRSVLARDYTAWHQALRARGLLSRLDDQQKVATPKPLNDLEAATARVRSLVNRTATQA